MTTMSSTFVRWPLDDIHCIRAQRQGREAAIPVLHAVTGEVCGARSWHRLVTTSAICFREKPHDANHDYCL